MKKGKGRNDASFPPPSPQLSSTSQPESGRTSPPRAILLLFHSPRGLDGVRPAFWLKRLSEVTWGVQKPTPCGEDSFPAWDGHGGQEGKRKPLPMGDGRWAMGDGRWAACVRARAEFRSTPPPQGHLQVGGGAAAPVPALSLDLLVGTARELKGPKRGRPPPSPRTPASAPTPGPRPLARRGRSCQAPSLAPARCRGSRWRLLALGSRPPDAARQQPAVAPSLPAAAAEPATRSARRAGPSAGWDPGGSRAPRGAQEPCPRGRSRARGAGVLEAPGEEAAGSARGGGPAWRWRRRRCTPAPLGLSAFLPARRPPRAQRARARSATQSPGGGAQHPEAGAPGRPAPPRGRLVRAGKAPPPAGER